MPVKHPIQPSLVSPVMTQQAVPHTVAGPIRAGAGVDVVVQFEVADPVPLDQPVDHSIQVAAGRRVAQVKVVAAVLHNPLAGPLQEGSIRQAFRHRAAHPDNLRLQP